MNSASHFALRASCGRLNRHPLAQSCTAIVKSRSMMLWVTNIFNRVDHSQLSSDGPDRTATDFVLRMGGLAKISKTSNDAANEKTDWLQTPSDLPKWVRTGCVLRDVNLDKVAVTDVGMEHFRNLNGLNTISLKSCRYITDDGLAYLKEGNVALELIDVSDTAITMKGANNLQLDSSVTVVL
eukprot:CFRG6901T1